MKKNIILSLTTALLIGGNFVSASAQTAPSAEAHPRINQVERRIDKQESRIDAAEKAGKITAEQAAQNKERLATQEQQLQKDAAEHGGHITKKEQKELNKDLNQNHKMLRDQKHHKKD